MTDLYGNEIDRTPCDENENHYCPFEDYPSESDRCRCCCGLGVDENQEWR